jgi:hypothetical protein
MSSKSRVLKRVRCRVCKAELNEQSYPDHLKSNQPEENPKDRHVLGQSQLFQLKSISRKTEEEDEGRQILNDSRSRAEKVLADTENVELEESQNVELEDTQNVELEDISEVELEDTQEIELEESLGILGIGDDQPPPLGREDGDDEDDKDELQVDGLKRAGLKKVIELLNDEETRPNTGARPKVEEEEEFVFRLGAPSY